MKGKEVINSKQTSVEALKKYDKSEHPVTVSEFLKAGIPLNKIDSSLFVGVWWIFFES